MCNTVLEEAVGVIKQMLPAFCPNWKNIEKLLMRLTV